MEFQIRRAVGSSSSADPDDKQKQARVVRGSNASGIGMYSGPLHKTERYVLFFLVALLAVVVLANWGRCEPPRVSYVLVGAHPHTSGGDSKPESQSASGSNLRISTTSSMPTVSSPDLGAVVPPIDLRGGARTRSCTARERELQGKMHEAAKVRGCPSDDDGYFRLIHSLIPDATVFVDIGSNKGYTAARIFELWSPQLGLDAKLLHEHLRLVAGHSRPELTECGACNDCRGSSVPGPILARAPRLCSASAGVSIDVNSPLAKYVDALCADLKDSFRPVRVYSFDGNPEMCKGVNEAIASMAKKTEYSNLLGVRGIPPARLPAEPLKTFLATHWTVELAAFLDTYEEGKTIDFTLGEGEKGHIITSETNNRQASDRGRVSVPALTVDELVRQKGLSKIDLLKIDVEGHDPMVLRGARESLASGKVGLLTFEYNKVWGDRDSLFRVVRELETESDMACYLEGKNALLKLTHGCWSNPLELRKWSNVWCASLRVASGIAVAAVFDSHTLAFV